MTKRIPDTKRPVRIALVEPNESDARWLAMAMDEAQRPAIIVRYPTGVDALQTWKERGAPEVDVIVMSDALPMLSAQEFVDAARALVPGVPVVMVGEKMQLRSLPNSGVHRFTKPLATDDVHILHQIISERRTKRGVQPSPASSWFIGNSGGGLDCIRGTAVHHATAL